MLIARVTRHIALTRLDLVESQRGMLRGNEQPLAARMKPNAAQLFGLLNRLEGFFRRRFRVLKELDRVVATTARQNRLIRMKRQRGDLISVIV